MTVAEGRVEFRRGGLVIRADRLTYDTPEDLAHGAGRGASVGREGAVYSGPELQLRVQRFEGFFLQPEFELGLLGSGGRAQRIDFMDSERSRAYATPRYSSCPRDGGSEPDWLLRTDRVKLDFEANEGVAEGAVLRFLGTAHPGLAGAELSADRCAQVGLAAAQHRARQPQRLRAVGALLLEHRAESRRHRDAACHHAARAGPGRRVPLPRAAASTTAARRSTAAA